MTANIHPQESFYIKQKRIPGTVIFADPAKDAEGKGVVAADPSKGAGEFRAGTKLVRSMDEVPPLFQPIKIRDVQFPNRIQVSPMCMYSCDDGFATDFHLVNSGQYFLRGVGMAMVEATAVSAEGRISHRDLGIWKDEHIAPLKRLTDFAHSVSGKIGIQIGHAGRKASTWPLYEKDGRSLVHEEDGGWPSQVVAPSAIEWASYMANPKELADEQIQSIVKKFQEAARRALEAGFDVLEIHGAHGYLIHQFLSPVSNTRTDKYGGSLENRARFLLEIVEAIRKVWPQSHPLFLRLSTTDWLPGKSSWDIDEVVQVVKWVAERGVDVIDASSGGNHPDQVIKYGPGFQVPNAARIAKDVPQVKVIAVGALTHPKELNEIIAKGEAHFVMMAREFLRDGWVYRAGKELGIRVAFINQYERGG